jgi:hypothetical protein
MCLCELRNFSLELSKGANSSFLLYLTEDGKVKIEMHFEKRDLALFNGLFHCKNAS